MEPRCLIDASHYGLVKRIAFQFMHKVPANIEIDDLVQAGMIGLLDAANRYESERGPFEPFAAKRIRGSMLDEMRAGDHLSRSVRTSQKQIEKAVRAIEQSLGRPATDVEIAGHMAISVENYQKRRARAYDTQLLHIEDLAIEEGDVDYFMDRRVARDDNSPLRRLEDQQQRVALVSAITLLPERERNLMLMYYEQDMNYSQIAKQLQVTESRICQMHAECLARLRKMLREY